MAVISTKAGQLNAIKVECGHIIPIAHEVVQEEL